MFLKSRWNQKTQQSSSGSKVRIAEERLSELEGRDKEMTRNTAQSNTKKT